MDKIQQNKVEIENLKLKPRKLNAKEIMAK